MSEEEYTGDDWVDLENKIDFLEEYYEIHTAEMKLLRKASDFIKKTLGIKTEPIVKLSLLTNTYYYTNVYTDTHMISKRPATEEEIKDALERMKK